MTHVLLRKRNWTWFCDLEDVSSHPSSVLNLSAKFEFETGEASWMRGATTSRSQKQVELHFFQLTPFIVCLQGFYDEVATPLLTDVTMVYAGGSNLTQTNFSQYYNGSEIVVAGELTDNDIETFIPQVVAISVRLSQHCSQSHVELVQNVFILL